MSSNTRAKSSTTCRRKTTSSCGWACRMVRHTHTCISVSSWNGRRAHTHNTCFHTHTFTRTYFKEERAEAAVGEVTHVHALTLRCTCIVVFLQFVQLLHLCRHTHSLSHTCTHTLAITHPYFGDFSTKGFANLNISSLHLLKRHSFYMSVPKTGVLPVGEVVAVRLTRGAVYSLRVWCEIVRIAVGQADQKSHQ